VAHQPDLTGAPVAPELTQARLSLVSGARIVLRNLLTLLGVSAPEKM
jgi:arginyl-tRNA synthetase